MHITTIRTIESFIKEIERIASAWDKSDCTCWYRGQSDSKWNIQPSIHRTKYKGLIKKEYSMMLDFISESQQYLELKPLPDDPWGWLSVMQHYEMPTRLLDWTDKPLVALYFALKDEANTNAAVWLLDPCELNHIARNDHCVYSVFPRSSFCKWKTFLEDYLPNENETITGDIPVAIQPPQYTARMRSQSGLFTIHGSKSTGIDQRTKELNIKHLEKLVIPKGKRQHILKQLYNLITEADIFPEVTSISKKLAREYLESFGNKNSNRKSSGRKKAVKRVVKKKEKKCLKKPR